MKKITFVFSSFFLLSCFLLPAEVLSAQCGVYEGVEEFDDVKNTNPYYEDICFLKKNRWAEGQTVKGDDGKELQKFIPDNKLTRGEFAKILLRCKYNDIVNPPYMDIQNSDVCYSSEYAFVQLLKSSVSDCFSDGKFSDIKNKNEWYVKYMCRAKEDGIIVGNASKGNKALPNDLVTFIEALKMTMKVLGFNDQNSCWKDGKAWQDKYLYSLITNEIISDFSINSEKTGNMNGNISRGYAAHLIKKIYDSRKIINNCQESVKSTYQFNSNVIKIRTSPSLEADAIKISDNTEDEIDIIGNPFTGASVDENDEWVMVEDGGRLGFVNTNDNYYLDLPYSDVLRVTQGNNDKTVSHFDHGTWDNTYALDFGKKCKYNSCTDSYSSDTTTIYGKSVLAPANGKVVCVYDENHNGGEECGSNSQSPNGLISGGRVLVMKDNKGNYFTFLHLKKIIFPTDKNDAVYSVKRGNIIAEIGTSGADAIHLHFHLWPGKGLPPSSHTTAFTANTPLKVGIGCENNIQYLWGKKLDESEMSKTSICSDKMPTRQFYSFNKE